MMKIFIRKCLLLVACCLVLAGVLNVRAQAADGDVSINSKNFPDPVLRKLISKECDVRAPYGILDAQEIAEYSVCNINNVGVRSIQGLELLTGIKELSIRNETELHTMNFKTLSPLTSLNINNCGLAYLDFSGMEDIPLSGYGEGIYYTYARKDENGCFYIEVDELPEGFAAENVNKVSGGTFENGRFVAKPGYSVIKYEYKVAPGFPLTFKIGFMEAEPLAFWESPTDQSGVVGESVSFIAYASGSDITYQWQYKNTNASKWSDSGAAAAKTPEFSFDIGPDIVLNGRQYRCVITDKWGNTLVSEPATLSVLTPVSITNQPKNVTTGVGTGATFTVSAKGDGLKYQWQYRNANTTTWNKSNIKEAATANLTFTVSGTSLSGRQYRCVITDKYGNKIESIPATLYVGNIATIKTQPISETANVGTSVTFKIVATGDGLKYQWQYKNVNSSTWSNSNVAAAQTANFTFAVADKSLSGRQYRCVVTDKYGNSQTSSVATLSVGTSMIIKTQPSDVSAASGTMAKFAVVATGDGLTYQWQYRNAGATTWSNSKAKTATSSEFSFNIGTDSSLNGRQYRCVVTDQYGTKKESSAATLSVWKDIKITKQPANVTNKAGQTATFSIAAEGDGLTYQWQYKNAGATAWSNSGAKAAKTTEFSFPIGTDSYLNGRQYRCVITDQHGRKKESTVATLNVGTPLTIKTQPSDLVLKVGKQASFSVVANGDGLTYQWQYKNSGASTWSNSKVSVAKTNTFTFTVPDNGVNGRQYRCVVTDKYGNKKETSAVTLTVAKDLTITKQPESVTVDAGEHISFTCEADGDGLTYQWRERCNGGEWEMHEAGTDTTYGTGTDIAMIGNNYEFSCVVTDRYGDSIESENVTITLMRPLEITTQPKDLAVDLNKTATFTIEANGDGLTYQWQITEEYSNYWEDYEGDSAKTNKLTFDVTSEYQDNRDFRCVVTDQYGRIEYSERAHFTISGEKHFVIMYQPDPVMYLFEGSEECLSVGTSGEWVDYQWQMRTSSSGSWVDLNDWCASEDTYFLSVTKSMNGYQYRCKITDDSGYTLYTNGTTLYVE